MKWIRRILIGVLTLIVMLLLASAAGWKLMHARPSWYPAPLADPQALAEAARRADEKLAGTMNWVGRVRAQEIRSRYAGSTAPAPEPVVPLKLELTDDELNAFFAKWDNAYHWSAHYGKYLSDPTIILHDHHLIFAATVKDLGSLVSTHFSPEVNGRSFELKTAGVYAGNLPLPQSLWDSYREKLEAAMKAKLPELQERAAISSDGSANHDAVAAAMGESLLRILNEKPAEPILFLPYDLGHLSRSVPVKLTDVEIEEHTISLTVLPLTLPERQALLRRIRQPLDIATAMGG